MNETTPPTPPTGEPRSAPGAPQQPAGTGFFDWLRGLGISRGDDRWFAGVAGGIAARANIDPIIIRGVFVVLAVLGGPGILLYLAGWLLLPDKGGRIHLEEVFRGRASTAAIVAFVAVCVFLFLPILLRLVGATTFGGWGLWEIMGFPSWLSTTISVFVWIAVIAAAIVLISMLVLRHGRTVRDSGGAQTPAADSTAAPFSAEPAGASQAYDAAQATAPPFVAASAPLADSATASTSSTSSGASSSSASAPPGDWTQRLSESTERFGQRANQWGEEASKRADEWSARYAEHHDAHKLGAAHVVISLAFALLAAGGAALWAMDSDLWEGSVLTAAIIGATAALALSLVVAGIRGRHTGWVGFLAFCGVVALVFTSLLPGHTRFQPFGIMDVSSSDESTVLIAGSSRIDLTNLDGTQEPQEIVVWSLIGNSRVKVPDSHPVVVKVYVLAGNITAPSDISGSPIASSGPFLSRTIDTRIDDDEPATEVSVYMLAGNVRVGNISLLSGRTQDLRVEADGSRAETQEALDRLRDEEREIERDLEDSELSDFSRELLEDNLDSTRDEIAKLEKELVS